MLVPAATSIGIRCSSNHRMTPMCARPRALPPPNATPTTGRPSTTGGPGRSGGADDWRAELPTGARRNGAAQPVAKTEVAQHSARHANRHAGWEAGLANVMSR